MSEFGEIVWDPPQNIAKIWGEITTSAFYGGNA